MEEEAGSEKPSDFPSASQQQVGMAEESAAALEPQAPVGYVLARQPEPGFQHMPATWMGGESTSAQPRFAVAFIHGDSRMKGMFTWVNLLMFQQGI